jgi:hypothetical protein
LSPDSDIDAGRITLPHLRSLIGLRVRHQGTLCVVMEVLESPPALVLEPVYDRDAASAADTFRIMANLHGHPGEYGVESRIVQVLTEDQTGLDDALLDLEIIDQ